MKKHSVFKCIACLYSMSWLEERVIARSNYWKFFFFHIYSGCPEEFSTSASLLEGNFPPPPPDSMLKTAKKGFLDRVPRYIGTERVDCLHTIDGICVRQSDYDKLQGRLVSLFEKSCFSLREHEVNLLIRMHWPGQTFVRLQRIRGDKGEKQPPFHEGRYQSCFGEKN